MGKHLIDSENENYSGFLETPTPLLEIKEYTDCLVWWYPYPNSTAHYTLLSPDDWNWE